MIVVGIVDYFEKNNHNDISCWSGELGAFDCDQQYRFYISNYFAVEICVVDVVAFPVVVALNGMMSHISARNATMFLANIDHKSQKVSKSANESCGHMRTEHITQNTMY
mgnify:CR=1 FL=1